MWCTFPQSNPIPLVLPAAATDVGKPRSGWKAADEDPLRGGVQTDVGSER